jgi:hypothetical protein
MAKRAAYAVGAWGALVLLAACATTAPMRSVPRPSAELRAEPARQTERPPDGLRAEVFELARRAYECGRAQGHFEAPILTVIDYSLPSTERRLWVIDMRSGRVLFHELVAHGRNSGENLAIAFSNRPGSKQSSLGLFRTAGTYEGRHGYSLRLSGLEPGVNDAAWERSIVVHGAPYVGAEFAAQHGRLGRSWGCPALAPGVHRRVIERIRNGTALFVYYPDGNWLSHSRFLACPDARPRVTTMKSPRL